MRRIRVPFNDNKQELVFVVKGRVDTFLRLNDCYAYYVGKYPRYQRRGVFGYIHLPHVHKQAPLFHELIAHEVQHAIFDWVLCRRGGYINTSNEERIATMTGEIVRRFWSQYKIA